MLAVRQATKEAEQAKEEVEQAKEEAEQAKEEAVRLSLKTTLLEFLDALHVHCSRNLSVQTDQVMGTQVIPASAPRNRLPTNIKAWDRFPDEQYDIWKQLQGLDEKIKSLCPIHSFQSLQEAGDHSLWRLIGSKKDLEFYERNMVEDPVEEIIHHFFKVPEIRQRLNLKSSVKFENHPNTLIDNTELRAHLKKLQITQQLPIAVEGCRSKMYSENRGRRIHLLPHCRVQSSAQTDTGSHQGGPSFHEPLE